MSEEGQQALKPDFKSRAAWVAKWAAFGSAVAIVLGIAPSHILLGVALLALLLSGEKPKLPPFRLALGIFLAGTLVALALSGDPKAGLPQVKKFYVFAELLVVYSLLRGTSIGRWVVLGWAACGLASAAVGLAQFGLKLAHLHQTGQNTYDGYVTQRITGFMGHWFTFSGEEMIVLIMFGAFLLFSPMAKRRPWLWGLAAIPPVAAVLLAETRAVWIAAVVAAVYLVWSWRPKVTLAVPVVLALGFLVSPAVVKERVVSIVRPGAQDSNAFRAILRRTGVEMIKAHPWFGLGPEMPRKRFFEFLPKDIPLPLPSGSTMHLHNVYLEYAAERGVPMLLVFLWMLAWIVRDFRRGLTSLPEGRSDARFLLHGGIAVILALLVEGYAEYNFGDSEVLGMFLSVVALGYAALDEIRGKAAVAAVA